jgi:dimethylaniline monooxygenase (N-oxide forming)
MLRSAAIGTARVWPGGSPPCNGGLARCTPSRGFAYNIYEDLAEEAEAVHKGTPSEAAEAIFLQHASGMGGLRALQGGAPFRAACQSLAKEYPQLKALTDPALEGRAFEIFDTNDSGVVDLKDFIQGVQSLLNPTTERYKNLKKRLEQGLVNVVDGRFDLVKRVAVIGGGVAGLQTARALSRRGKEVVIFEKSDNVGGVWKANYDAFGLQVPKELYEFPEFPYPAGTAWEKFPPGPQVQQYIESYCEQFGLKSMIRFNTGVSKVELGSGGNGWNVFAGGKDETPKEEHFDFVVIATGMYGWPPHIPRVRGRADFEGDVYHSANFFDAKVCQGKNVVVIGGGKSAVDNAVSGARHGISSALVYRTAHWPVPRHLLNLVPFKWGTYSRFGHFMLPTHFDVSSVAWYFHSVLAPLKWTWWRIVELMFRVQFRLSGDMVPNTPIEIDVFSGGQILNYNFRDMLKDGKVKAIKGSIERLHPKHVELQDGTKLPCDVLVFGTGFAKSYDLFDRLVQNKLNIEQDGIFMHRNIIPPNVSNLAFVGSEVSTFNNILTHGLQAEWLARVLDNKIELPERRRMLARIEKMQAWKRTWMPATSARAAILQLHMLKYHDRLIKDMGENHLRKGANKLAEAFAPYSAADYRGVFLAKPEDAPQGKALA